MENIKPIILTMWYVNFIFKILFISKILVDQYTDWNLQLFILSTHCRSNKNYMPRRFASICGIDIECIDCII